MLKINQVYNSDCLEGLKLIDDESIQTFWTDPPYNINYKYDEYEDVRSDYYDWCDKWLKEAYRVLKKDGSLFVKMWSRHLMPFLDLLKKNNFVFKNLIVWKRKSCANYDNKYLGGYELIFFFTKTENNKFIPDAFLRNTQFLKRWDGTKEYKGRVNDLWDDVHHVTAGNLIHPEGIYKEGTGEKCHSAQHPEELVLRSILCTTEEGDTILDIFSGSGTSLAVAKKTGRNYIGFEISKEYCNVIEERLSKISFGEYKRQNKLPEDFL